MYATLLFRIINIKAGKEMPSAFVLFNVTPGSEDQVLSEVIKTIGVEEAHVSYGVYDLIVRAKTDSAAALNELVIHKLRSIANVKSTLTLTLPEDR